jgi:hypothetical protein
MADRTVRDILARFDANGTVIYKPRGGLKKPKLNACHEEHLKRIIDEEDTDNILTLTNLKEKLYQTFPQDFPSEKSLSLSAISECVNRSLMLTLKRNNSTTASLSETNQEINDMVNQSRREYCENVISKNMNYLDNCVFVDESSFTAYMVPGKARSSNGKRADILSKAKRARKISIFGAMSATRIESLQVVTVDKYTDKLIFNQYIAELLEWIDKEYNRPMFVIIDSSKFNQAETNIQHLFAQSQHTCQFLPSYSSMFNPMENMFSELKNFVKRSPKEGKESIVDLIKAAGTTITTKECTDWVEECIVNIGRYLKEYTTAESQN